jgi:hypothetical protein
MHDDTDCPPWTPEQLERGVRGRVLRLARHSLAMDHAAFADALGIPLADSRDFERGRRLADPATVERARALRATVSDDLAFERAGKRRRF